MQQKICMIQMWIVSPLKSMNDKQPFFLKVYANATKALHDPNVDS